MAGATLRSQDPPRFSPGTDLLLRPYACILLPMSTRYSLSRTCSDLGGYAAAAAHAPSALLAPERLQAAL